MIFLIAHKVRGEPAFDVAELLSIGPEEAWIIPTSGHRAYPLAYWAIEDLADLSDYPHPTPWTIIDKLDFSACPDHYPCNDKPPPKGSIDILSILNLRRPTTEPLKRRI